MTVIHLPRWIGTLFIVSLLVMACADGKGFGGGRGGGFKGGSRGGGSFGGSKGAGAFGGSSSYNRGNQYGSYNSMNKPGSGSSFRKNAMSFGAGALGGVAAYSVMRSMSSSYHSGPGYYRPGYGKGDTCTNNEDMGNGTRFGQFRCPLNEYSLEDRYCCGEYGKQYCCPGSYYNRPTRSSSNFVWICVIFVIVLIAIVLFAKHRRQSHEAVMVPVEPPMDEQRPPFYQPPPPPTGYPVPPMGYQPNFNPYAVPPQNSDGTYNPYPPQQMPYPPQQIPYPPQQMPYPPQQHAFNPYQVKEGGPPAYSDAVNNSHGIPPTKPM